MADLKPLPKKITNEIRKILEGCKSGKLEHRQTDYHCGTAHCIAGWKVALDHAKEQQLKLSDPAAHRGLYGWEIKRERACRYDSLSWGYVQGVWGLTDAEADALFAASASFPTQFRLLEKLERGERVA